MNGLIKILAAVLTGVVVFLAVGIGVSVVLDPYVWPSLFVGIPVGFASGVAATGLTYASLTYWTERDSEGGVSPSTADRLWTTLAALGGFLFATVVAVVAAVGLSLPIATTMLLVWLPLGLVSGLVAAFFGLRASRRRRGGRPSV